MDVWKAIDSIRVVRTFSDRDISAEDLERILDAGRRAASSKNLQRWAFVVIKDRARLAELAQVGHFASHVAGANVAVALVTPDPHAPDQPLSVMFDLGRSAQNMVLAAWERGIGHCPATVYEHERASELLGLPPDQHCEYILSFGYPAEPSALTQPKTAGGRRSLEEVVHTETW